MPSIVRLMLPFVAVSLLAGCDLFLGDDGDPVLIGIDFGEVQRLTVTDESASPSWSGAISPSNQVRFASDASAVYASSGRELIALQAEEGTRIWANSVFLDADLVALAGPANGRVFGMTFDCVVAWQTSDGAELWRADLLLELAGAADDALLLAGGSLYLGGDPIRRIDPASGDVLAEYVTDSPDVSDLVLQGSTLYAGSADGVLALDAQTLDLEWAHSTDDEVDHLAASPSGLFFSVLAGGVGALDWDGGVVGTAGAGEVYEALAVSSGLLLAVRSDGELQAYDEGDMSVVWAAPGSVPSRGLAVGLESAYYANGGGLEGIALSDGSHLWSMQTDGAVVAVSPL